MSAIPTPTEAEQLAEIMDRVKTWSMTTKLALAKHVLDTLDLSQSSPRPRRRPVEQWIGLGAGSSPPPRTMMKSVPGSTSIAWGSRDDRGTGRVACFG